MMWSPYKSVELKWRRYGTGSSLGNLWTAMPLSEESRYSTDDSHDTEPLKGLPSDALATALLSIPFPIGYW